MSTETTNVLVSLLKNDTSRLILNLLVSDNNMKDFLLSTSRWRKNKSLTTGEASNSCFHIVIARLQDQGYVIFATKREGFSNESNLSIVKKKEELNLTALKTTRLIHRFTICCDKRPSTLTSVFGFAELLRWVKFKSARTWPFRVSKKSFPTRRKHEVLSYFVSKFSRKCNRFPRKEIVYEPCFAEFFFAILIGGDICAGLSKTH